MTSVRSALTQARRALRGISPTAQWDAELLMAHALGVDRTALRVHDQETTAPASFRAMVDRRIAGEPVAYILGEQGFWTIDLLVGPGALIPRGDSETLLRAAVDHFRDRAPTRILDLGTGPGTLLLAALDQWPQAVGLGIDASAEALDYATRNAARLGMAERATLRLGDWAAGITDQFDLILGNPPYIAPDDGDLERHVAMFEPAMALFAGADGLDAYRAMIPQLAPCLAVGGLAVLEIGWKQRAAVTALAQDAGFTVTPWQDYAGRDRALALTHDGATVAKPR